ncbi:MAG: YifB family Mg chelatase-like AAA ATPase, partial [Pseudomonadota bacterium]
MSLAVLHSRGLDGLHAPEITVEVHLSNGLPSFTLVGLAETEVKEARERVRCALNNSGLDFPHNRRITVNLAPAELPKESGRFDLPIALGILAASGQIDATRLQHFEFVGELSLAGDVRPVRGALPLALGLRRSAPHRALVLPSASAPEAALVPGLKVHTADHLLEVVQALLPGDAALCKPLPWAQAAAPATDPAPVPDWRDVKGQQGAKRALEVAAAGGHSALLVGPPGTGKSMLAQRFVHLLPRLNETQALSSAALWSLAGRFDAAHWARRPFRAPHHSATAPALVGGGSPPRPGEISLAHEGVLFLDELPEYPRSALEALREPLENGRITISRAGRQAEFPARFQLLAAMNPCPCGHLGHPRQACRCSPDAVARYQGRLSGPLLDRIDLQIEVPAVHPATLSAAPEGDDTATVAQRVLEARDRQWQRQGALNAHLDGAALATHATLPAAAADFFEGTCLRLGWSARAHQRVLRIARTVADLQGLAD